MLAQDVFFTEDEVLVG